MQLALQHHHAGRLADAEAIYRQILAQQPNYAEALHLLGVLATQVGRLDVAVDLIRRAIRLAPDSAEMRYNLGHALHALGQFDEAIISYRHAIHLKPDLTQAYNNLANALRETGQMDEAIATFHQALRLKPDFAEAYNNLGSALKVIGQLDAAIDAFRQATRLQPNYVEACGNLVYAIQSHPAYGPGLIREEHRHWNQKHAEPLRKFIQPHTNDRRPHRRLRIGYVSADFRIHVVGQNLLPLFREHDHRQVEVFCYASMLREDAFTEQLRQFADTWRNIAGIADSQAADLIRQDGIDILVDLALHTSGNRLLIFARKPAPVQVTYLGYCSSTGLDTMDYRLSDPYLDPPDSDLSMYSEKTIRLPETYWCYASAGLAPDPSPPPVKATGYITFGCLNNFAKASPALDLWTEILQSVPQSRLIIHSHLGTHLNAVRERFKNKDIFPDRLEFLGRQPWPEYIQIHSRIDIALDPFPWGGGITTCDALWMGVPVVTLLGRTPVGRGGASILSNIGLPELIASTPEEYAQIATDLAKDFSRLAELRRTLRPRMQASPLMNAPRFARNIEAAYRQMWQTWCTEGRP